MSKNIKKLRSNLTKKVADFELTRKEIRNGYVHAYYCAVSGFPEILEYKCKIPAGYTDLDLSTLKDECLTGDLAPNKESLIK